MADLFPVYKDIDGVRTKMTAYKDIDGVRTKISSAEDDSIVGTWVFNNTVTLPSEVVYYINFSCSTVSYSKFSLVPSTKRLLYILANGGGGYLAYDNGWELDQYMTVTITGGSDITNETFITWLKANATKQ